MRGSYCIIFLILFCHPSVLHSQTDILVDTGHQGAITALTYDIERNLLFSGGEEGSVNIWDGRTKMLIASLNISHYPISKICIHPVLPQIAVLEDVDLTSTHITVWDWEKNIEVFSLQTTEQILYISYSTLGNFLVYSVTDWYSLKVIDSQRGLYLPLMNKGFGIVSYFVFSRTEKNIMIYQPSGSISYWDFATGTLLEQIDTINNLSNFNITNDNKYMVASKDSTFYLINLLSGEVVNQKAEENLYQIQLQDNSNLFLLFNNNNQIEITRCRLEGTDFQNYSVLPLNFNNPIVTMTEGEEGIYVGDNSGSIYLIFSSGQFKRISQCNLLRISGIAVFKDSIAIASQKGILIFKLNISETNQSMETLILASEGFKVVENPFETSIGINFLDQNRLIVWDKSETNKGLAVYNIITKSIEKRYQYFTSSIHQLSVNDNNLIILEKNGELKILDINSFEQIFTYFSPGMNKIITISDKILIGVQTRRIDFSGPLLIINPQTGETVPIPGTSLFSYDCIFDSYFNRLYSLSAEQMSNGIIITCIKTHYGSEFETENTLQSYYGEDFSASMVLVTEDKKLYTTLGFDSIKSINLLNNSITELEKSSHVPRELFISKDLLLSLNHDSSVTVWDRYNQKILLEFYLFDDLSWIALFQKTGEYLSHNAEDYIISD
jgi:hypothetical protein